MKFLCYAKPGVQYAVDCVQDILTELGEPDAPLDSIHFSLKSDDPVEGSRYNVEFKGEIVGESNDIKFGKKTITREEFSDQLKESAKARLISTVEICGTTLDFHEESGYVVLDNIPEYMWNLLYEWCRIARCGIACQYKKKLPIRTQRGDGFLYGAWPVIEWSLCNERVKVSFDRFDYPYLSSKLTDSEKEFLGEVVVKVNQLHL